MTKEDIKNYLEDNVDIIKGHKDCIRSLQYYKEHTLAAISDSYLKRQAVRDVDKHIEHEQKQLLERLRIVQEWSQLIKKEHHRHIFVERYMNGLTWQEIESTCHYSHSSLFHINKRCMEEIAKKTVCDIVPDCNNQNKQAISG